MRAALIGFVVAVIAGPSLAQFSEDRLRAQLAAQGYERIEMSDQDGQIRVDAERGKIRLHSIYEQETGDLISERRSQIKPAGTNAAAAAPGAALPEASAPAGTNAPAEQDDKTDGIQAEGTGFYATQPASDRKAADTDAASVSVSAMKADETGLNPPAAKAGSEQAGSEQDGANQKDGARGAKSRGEGEATEGSRSGG